MRFALGVEYDGSDFSGWERQRDRRTVQASLEAALARVAARPVRTVCAGRTDAGVHAIGQVVHFDTEARRELQAWTLGSNTHLPDDVTVNWAHRVTGEFHARYSARCRHYRYLIVNRRVRSALLRRRVAWEHRPLDAARMQAGAEYLLGEHDFTSFRAVGCQAKSAVRKVHGIEVGRDGDLITIEVSANAFLQHMVRNFAGVLMEVGMGKREPRWVLELLEARDRTEGGVTAPADGLYLTQVEYPAEFDLPAVSSPGSLW